ncbi:S8 family serine peptidase [Micromonospora sp. 4G57]|uniref:S8 family serine peptidase n=1 Tax=Micromonospora sicca TaxID=2202420 RepID=A0ABU5JDB5_9ACTN|nr:MULTISPECIES: S8 family serine peptidase [unclassified Micromonospora]MDZ5441989.1 S8 family serine peptidase [Micromonospora sp. 4G57]MDZ5490584.1 S8 family serine peptidase [Micromonospora sp. 4G53]
MSRTPIRRNRAAAAVLASVLTAGALTTAFAGAPANAQPSVDAVKSSAAGWTPTDQDRLTEARDRGQQTVTVLVGAQSGQVTTVADGLAGLGANVLYRDDTLGYLRAEVAVDRADRVPQLNGVQTVEIDAAVPLPDPRPDASEAPAPQPAPGKNTPAVNPYMPIGDMGAAQFVADHPTVDGRGATVGIIDTGVDLAHPALRTTTTGERKIVDWVTATSPTEDGDPTWISMATNISGPTFTADNRSWTAPGSGSYRFGVFNERAAALGGEVGNDVNRDGNPAGSSGLFGVLWDGGSTVWVDTNQNGSFADQTPMTDYKVRYDVGTFGTDDPATPIAESMPFVVQVDGKGKFVNIGIVAGAHGSHVAGITAANGLFGGAMTGAAPGAKLVSVRVCMFVGGCTSHALIEGMIYAAKQANVDVINMSIGGLPSLNDGNNTRALLYNRLIDQYNVQMFISAGNSGPGTNTVGDPSVAEKVMSIGSYVTDATWRANYGSSSPYADNLHYYSSRGPGEDGGFKPNVVAPGSAISSIPTWQPGGPVTGTYALPPGYAMFNGTSMASPQAAGAGALLVSAAKAQGFQRQPAQIRQAMMSSARFIDNAGAYEQGAGLINVPAAYELLRKNIKTVGITSSVPVNTVLSGFLARPGVGVGIYDREGVTVGKEYNRTYTFTRTSGGSKAVTYNLSWLGNDGTFATGTSVALPLNKPVTLTVKVNPATPGAHSAVLRLDDPATTGVDYQTMNMVVAPYAFQAGDNYQARISDTVGRNQSLHYYFKVPAGTPALKVDFAGPTGAAGAGQARFLRYHPYGVAIDDNASSSCYVPAAGVCATGSATSRTTSNPLAGVWEVTVDGRRTSDAEWTPFTLTASVLGATVSPNPDVIDSATANTPVSRSYTMTSTLGAFTGRAVGTTLGSARQGPFTIANHGSQEYDLTVSPGSTQLRATIGGTSDPGADLDLYVLNCTSGTCVEAGRSADGDSEESVTIATPAAGAWKVRVDGYSVPAGSTSYNYIDVFTNPAFGTVAVTDANAPHLSGASWTVPGSVTAKAAPASGRVLYGNVQVRTDTNILIGSGDVVVRSVD